MCDLFLELVHPTIDISLVQSTISNMNKLKKKSFKIKADTPSWLRIVFHIH